MCFSLLVIFNIFNVVNKNLQQDKSYLILKIHFNAISAG